MQYRINQTQYPGNNVIMVERNSENLGFNPRRTKSLLLYQYQVYERSSRYPDQCQGFAGFGLLKSF